MSDPFDPRDLQVIFLREMHEARVRARDALGRAGRDAGDPAAVRELRNLFHRLAGSAGTVGHGMLARLAGACELAADQELERKGPLSKIAIRIFAEGLGGVDDILETRTPALGVLIPVLQRETGGPRISLEDVPSRVLVIDDDLVSARSTEAVLRAAGFLTASCCDPADAYEAILRESPDLIILDVLLGEVDGFDVCRRIRANQALQLVPIIFVTRRGDIVARYAGEEFAFVLVEATAQEAAVVAERMRARVEAQQFELPGGARLRATASIGIAEAQGQEPAAVLVQRADAALYQAKAA